MGLKQVLRSIGTILMPLGLIGIFIGSVVDPEFGEMSFGVKTFSDMEGNKSYPFHLATGLRDGILGILGFVIRFKYPQALLDFYMILLLVPIGDLIIVQYYAGSLIHDGIYHILGAFGTLILILLLRPDKTDCATKLKPV